MSLWNPFSWNTGDKVELDPNLGKMPMAGYLRRKMNDERKYYSSREAPQAGQAAMMTAQTGRAAQVDPRAQGQSRDVQLALANRLLGISTGQQQGAGEMAVQRQGNNAIAQAQGMARMGRGGNAATAARTAARSVGEIGLNTAGQASQAALSDQQMATGQLGAVAGQMRGQDVDFAGQNAQLKQGMTMANLGFQNQAGLANQSATNQQSLANLDAQLRARGMDDQARIATMAQMMGLSVAEMQGLLGAEQIRVGNAGTPIFPAVLGGAAQVGSAAAMASDRELKKDTRKVSRSIDEMLDKLAPQSYRYKDEGAHGEGRRAGIMAQDLERSEAGRRLIREMPTGKHVDVNAGLSAALASVARLNQRVRAMEKKAK